MTDKLLGFHKTADAHMWWRKWSTWLAGAAIAMDSAALYFVSAPPEWRAAFPPQFGFYLLTAGMVLKALIPLATSVRQKA